MPRLHLLPFVVPILALLLFAPAEAVRADDAADDGVVEVVVGAEGMSVEDFLRAVQQATGRSIVWNPADKNIRGKQIIGGVRLRARKSELFSEARSLLTFYELVFIPLGAKDDPSWTVMDARQTSSILKLKPETITLTEDNLATYEGKDGLFVTTTIQVEHMNDLRNARNALTRIVTGSNIGNVTEVPDAKAFVVTDFAPNVVAIYRLLRQMDRPNPTSSTTAGGMVAIELEHAVAAEAASTLTQLFAAQPELGPGRARQPAAATPPTAPRIVADARTNRLLVAGTRTAIEKVREAVTLLDVPVKGSQVDVDLVALEHAQADHVAGALGVLIQASGMLWRTGARGAAPVVVADTESNSLLVSGNAEALRAIRALIARMDKAR